MRVLSLFDGISCGQLALERAGVTVTDYFASEIDKYAIKVTQSNHADTVQLGDITKWQEWDLPEIDLIMAGFPCQAWSLAGKQKGDSDPRGALVHDLIAIWKHYKPKYFMFENVKMKKEFIEYINGLFGVEPILINSALVSAQNRQRLYWTNIPGITQPEDKGLLLKDIIESGDGCATYNRKDGLTKEIEKTHCMNASDWRGLNRNQNQTAVVDRDKSYCIDANYYKGGNLKSYFEKNRRQLVFEKPVRVGEIKNGGQGDRIYSVDGKSITLSAQSGGTAGNGSMLIERPCEPKYKGGNLKSYFEKGCRQLVFKAKNGKDVIINEDDITTPKTVYEARTELGKQLRREHRQKTGKDSSRRGPEHKKYVVQKHEKANCLVTVDSELNNIIDKNYTYRKLTPIECCRLQTLPDDYFDKSGISNTQRYKSIGNGWTVDVVAHIFKGIE